MQKESLIEQIIVYEFDMFSKVQSIDGRASCQDDWNTFHIMRFSQHALFSRETLQSYKEDLKRAREKGRNLIAEKYSYMMEETDKEYFERELRPYLTKVGERQEKLAKAIATVFIVCYEGQSLIYPKLLSSGRSLFGGAGGVTIPCYFVSELKTYSENTLLQMARDMIRILSTGENPVKQLYSNIVKEYGYPDLETAERQLSAG